jgi:hypothetical protein
MVSLFSLVLGMANLTMSVAESGVYKEKGFWGGNGIWGAVFGIFTSAASRTAAGNADSTFWSFHKASIFLGIISVSLSGAACGKSIYIGAREQMSEDPVNFHIGMRYVEAFLLFIVFVTSLTASCPWCYLWRE